MGFQSIFTDTILSGASTSAGVDLSVGSWNYVNLQIATMSTGVIVQLQNSTDNGTTYYNVYVCQKNTSTVATNTFAIAAAIGTNGGMVDIPNGLSRVRMVGTGVVSGGVNFKLICSAI